MIELLRLLVPVDAIDLHGVLVDDFEIKPGLSGVGTQGAAFSRMRDPDSETYRMVMDHRCFRVDWMLHPGPGSDVEIEGAICFGATWRRSAKKKAPPLNWKLASWGTSMNYPGHTISYGRRQTGTWMGDLSQRPPKPTYEALRDYFTSGDAMGDFERGCVNSGCSGRAHREDEPEEIPSVRKILTHRSCDWGGCDRRGTKSRRLKITLDGESEFDYPSWFCDEHDEMMISSVGQFSVAID